MKLAIASDHAGYELKEKMKLHLTQMGHEVEDFGTNSTESTDYPDYAHPLSASVESGKNQLGILICGSGNGVCMTANHHAGIRAALAWNKEIAELARQHNNANVLCLPARYISTEEAFAITEAYLNAHFEGGRHERRVEKIAL
ncbi:MAG: ribose 5-phosphate isomerase B [Bacteroidetes bacterium]|nr:ribose 5-phosphate isomerase B [Bacteroidota bacterium]